MSRVSDAMRQAGHGDDDRAIVPDDAAFVSGEDDGGAIDDDHAAAADVPAPAADVPAAIRGELVPHAVALPDLAARRMERAREDSGEDIRLQDVLRLLWRRRWVIAGVVATCLAVAVTYNRTAAPLYEATARVLIEPTTQQVVPFRSSGEDIARFDYFVTQIEIIRSRGLARRTLQRLGLPDDESRVGQILGSLRAAPATSELGESRVVNISAQSVSPERAAEIANAHAHTYVEQNLENLRRGSREASEWLNARLAELRRDVSSSQGALQAYREQQDAVSLEERQNIVVDKLAQLNTQVTSTRMELMEKAGLYQQLVALERQNAPLDTLPPILGNATVQGIKNELNNLRQQRTRLAATLLDTHPEMEEVDRAIADQERRLAVETAKVAESIKAEYRTAQAKEEGLIAALEAQKGEVLELNRKAIGYGALQRDATSIQQILDTVMLKWKETELSGDLPSNNIRFLDEAQVPGEAIWPRKSLNIAIALLLGTAAAVGLVFALEFLAPRLLDPDDVEASLGLPLLGTAPKVGRFGARGPLDVDAVPGSFQEAIRHIRAQIFLSAASAGVRTLAVTSARPGEGKTVMSASLAISIAMSGRRVLLVDSDLRRAEIAKLFNIPRAPGLSNVIAAEIKPSEALVESPIKGLYLLPAGDERSNPGDLLDSQRLSQLIGGLRKVFDVVVIDCPPVMAVADAAIVASAATSVVFVVSAGQTSRAVARRAVDRLGSVQARILGVVLNKTAAEPVADYYTSYHVQKDTVGRA